MEARCSVPQVRSSQVENADKVNCAREKLADNLITKTKLPSEYFTSLHYNDNAISAAAFLSFVIVLNPFCRLISYLYLNYR